MTASAKSSLQGLSGYNHCLLFDIHFYNGETKVKSSVSGGAHGTVSFRVVPLRVQGHERVFKRVLSPSLDHECESDLSV